LFIIIIPSTFAFAAGKRSNKRKKKDKLDFKPVLLLQAKAQ
jgi:hypothetical protein